MLINDHFQFEDNRLADSKQPQGEQTARELNG